MDFSQRHAAFTLLEVLIAVALTGVLLTLLIPAL
ncbi:MAG: type II secretion system protein, partial [Phycisphaerales bacterium]